MAFKREYRTIVRQKQRAGASKRIAITMAREEIRPWEKTHPYIMFHQEIPSARPSAPKLQIWFVCAAGKGTSTIASHYFAEFARKRKLPITLSLNTTGVWEWPNYNRPDFIVAVSPLIAKRIEELRPNYHNMPPVFELPNSYTNNSSASDCHQDTNRLLVAQILKTARKKNKKMRTMP
jgi:galactitol-specific phosphotransferase system IIB component